MNGEPEEQKHQTHQRQNCKNFPTDSGRLCNTFTFSVNDTRTHTGTNDIQQHALEALQIHILYPRTGPLAVVFHYAFKSFIPKRDTDIELFQDVSTQPYNKGPRQHWRTDL